MLPVPATIKLTTALEISSHPSPLILPSLLVLLSVWPLESAAGGGNEMFQGPAKIGTVVPCGHGELPRMVAEKVVNDYVSVCPNGAFRNRYVPSIRCSK